jgi:hypothetical protein
MASRFLFGSEAVTMRRNEAPKGPVRRLFVLAGLKREE